MINILRVTNEEYLDTLALLYNEYLKFYDQDDDLVKAKLFLRERISNQDSILFLASVSDFDNQICGFVQLYPVFSSLACQRSFILNDLYVLPEARQRGIATQLIRQAQNFCLESNGEGLALETAKDNPARVLYERLGFESDQVFIHYYWLGNKIMD